ncbi:MAG: T9SS type A sorting domain-containing protein, partial [Flavobacteriales bacterium]|nr:T9SS type A sorting domain-containing protein [Flavobacteriales bacterium]
SSEDNPPGDRRMLGSTGPFELAPGESDYINYAFVFARDSYDSEETPLETLQRFSDEVVSFACAPPADIVLSSEQPEAKKPNVNIFPNPATDRLSIELPNSGIQAKVFFHDSSGRLVDSFSTNGEAIITQSISLTPGAYLVTIQTEAHTWTEKMVVQP